MPPAPGSTPGSLILGCGYLGRRVATRLLARGATVLGTTRSPQRARQLADLGVRPLLLSVTQPLTFASLRPALEAPELDVYYLVPPGPLDAAGEVVRRGIANTRVWLSRAEAAAAGAATQRVAGPGNQEKTSDALRRGRFKVRRAILTSSTAVYDQGGTVTADTLPIPADERGRLLLEGERLWLSGAGGGAGERFHVLRLAGLYGPGRIIGLRALRDGAAIVGDPQAALNLIHADDAAELLIAMMHCESPARVELGCDDHPQPRIEYYRHLAAKLGLPEPAVLADDAAASELGLDSARLRGGSKVCDNTPTRQRTEWAPRYADFRAGLEAALPQKV